MSLQLSICLTSLSALFVLGLPVYAGESGQPSSATAEQSSGAATSESSDGKIKPSKAKKSKRATAGSALNSSTTSSNSSAGARPNKSKSTNVGNNTAPGVGMSKPNLQSASTPGHSGGTAGQGDKTDSWSQGTQNSGANAAVNGTGRQTAK
jgi:hypothetical protein